MKTDDIIIVGGGMVGLSLALMLAKKTSLSIAVLEASSSRAQHRVSAISLSSQKIFQSLQVWEDIRSEAISPFKKITVWDAAAKGEINFDCKEIAQPLLGYIIENNLIQTVLEKKLQQYSNVEIITPVQLTHMKQHEQAIEFMTDTGKIFKTRLAVAADGTNSWLRKQAGIKVEKFDYHQRAIVAKVSTSLPHHEIARQVFLSTGPLAFLPLLDEYDSSIVWSLPDEEATRLMKLDSETFQQELASAFEYRLGDIISMEQRFTFPLSRQKSRNYIKPHIALVGDAAHTVHPLAGQGVNMGLLDAASLSDVVVDAIQHRSNFASEASLRAYERWRKADNFMMYAGVDVIKNLFASDKKVVQNVRSLGLNTVDRIKCIKNIFTRHAVGVREGLPTLAK